MERAAEESKAQERADHTTTIAASTLSRNAGTIAAIHPHEQLTPADGE